MIKYLNRLNSLSTRFRESLLVLVFAAGVVALISCSKNTDYRSEERRWLPSGQITISRKAPEVTSPRSLNMLGFLPVLGTHAGIWLSVDSSKKEISLMDGNRVLSSSSAEGTDRIEPGTYQVLHMQKDALWYAPDSYFRMRNLPVPSQGDKARFRRGALGEYAIFINKDTPIHSGPVADQEVGGIRLKEADLSKIYYQLQVGSIIDVK